MHTKLWRTDEGMHYEKCSFVLLLVVISKLSIYQFRFYCLLRLLISTNETDAILVKKQLTQRWQRWWNQRSFVNVEPKHVDGSVLERRFFVKVTRDPSAIWPFTTEIRQLISELPLSGRFHTRDGLSVWDGWLHLKNPPKLTGKQIDKVRRLVHPILRPFHFSN